MVCGRPLTYHDRGRPVACGSCGREELGHIVCPAGHYLCETCHNRDAMRMIEDVILTSPESDPITIAEQVFSIPALPMLGCQHAYIAGGALMAAIKNAKAAPVGSEEIREVFARTGKQAHGGYCGLTGVCGVSPALGACVSLLTGSRCGTDREQRLTMEVVVRVSRAIAELTGPSCCKAYARAALKEAVIFLSEHLAIDLPRAAVPACRHSARHPHGCRRRQCPYFPGQDPS